MMQKIKAYIQMVVTPFFVQLIVRLIYFTSKKNFYHHKIDPNKNYIVAFWHGDLLMQPLHYRAFRPNGTVNVIVSEHKDGKLIKKVCQYLGVGAIDGSSSKGGAKALINAIKTLKRGVDVAITPDGPRGPIYSIADGIVLLSQKTDTKILPFSSQPSKYWQINSWDKFIIPKPFCTIDFYVGEPFSINGLEKEAAKELIFKKLTENQLQK